MTNKASDHGPPQSRLGYKLMVNCLKEHGDEIASKIKQMRDKDEAEEETQVYESIGQSKPESMESKELSDMC